MGIRAQTLTPLSGTTFLRKGCADGYVAVVVLGERRKVSIPDRMDKASQAVRGA